MDDPFNLQRFLTAQAAVYPAVLNELAQGDKRTHWMWFIFPQIKGLGHSETAQRFALRSADEARAYLAHPVLGERLLECTQTVLDIDGRDAHRIFGAVDAIKFRSSMTLFDAVQTDEPVFRQALERYFGGETDALTMELLQV